MITTEQMDGLLTPEDIAGRHAVYLQCRRCSKWTLVDIRSDSHTCSNTTKGVRCTSTDFDQSSIISARSFNPLTKRKVKGLKK